MGDNDDGRGKPLLLALRDWTTGVLVVAFIVNSTLTHMKVTYFTLSSWNFHL